MDSNAVAYLTGSEDPEALVALGGLRVVHTVTDSHPKRPGLGEALSWIESGQAEVLAVARLGAVARSLGELLRLTNWLGRHQATLVAADLGLNTGDPAGQLALAVLGEVQRWAREPESPRRPPGRPGLHSASPELARRIGEMRERGLSLAAIAQALNSQGVPTPRGGREWRPSSVQTALGYRRPPPGPGGPPPRPGPGGPPRPGPKAPKHR